MAKEGQEHPINVYIYVWLLLFVFSTGSYMVDYLQFQGLIRWMLILLFMFLKAGFIMAIFMHMVWERMALVTALILPTIAILLFVGIMSFESDYTEISRQVFFDSGGPEKVFAIPHQDNPLH